LKIAPLDENIANKIFSSQMDQEMTRNGEKKLLSIFFDGKIFLSRFFSLSTSSNILFKATIVPCLPSFTNKAID